MIDPQNDTSSTSMAEYTRLLSVIKKLRKECPWDREQTFCSLRPHIIEEAHELTEAINNADERAICEESGDLLLQVLLLAEIASETQVYDMASVLSVLTEKLIRRHPHVFATAQAETPDDVAINWERIKEEERNDKKGEQGALSGVPGSLPALMRAHKMQAIAAKKGFDWEKGDFNSVRDKILEELMELEEALQRGNKSHIEEEAGDLLFAVVNLTRRASVDAEFALQEACDKFKRRFGTVEQCVKDSNKEWAQHKLDELEEYWTRAKAGENGHAQRS